LTEKKKKANNKKPKQTKTKTKQQKKKKKKLMKHQNPTNYKHTLLILEIACAFFTACMFKHG
jgi:hypothetical protein